MLRFALLLIVFSLSTPSLAASWVDLGTTADGAKLEIDSSSIKQLPGGIRSAWFQYTSSKPDKDGVLVTKDLIRFNCGEDTMAIMSSSSFTAKGLHVKSFNTPSFREEYFPIVPESVGTVMARPVCISIL